MISLLRCLGIIKNVWYQSEIDLAEIEADEMDEFFNGPKPGQGG